MKMTKEEAFKMLQGKKVYAGEFTNEVQEKLFEIGFWWFGSGKEVKDHRFIITYNNGTLQTGRYDYFVKRKEEEITISQILGIELEPEFEDGDILHSDWEGEDITFIFKKTQMESQDRLYYYASMSKTLGILFDENYWTKDINIRYATKEECDKLLDAINKGGYKWNAEEKKLEKKRWRANKGEKYYCIDESVCVYGYIKYNDNNDDMYYNAHNYFQTEQEAQEYADKIKKLLKNR